MERQTDDALAYDKTFSEAEKLTIKMKFECQKKQKQVEFDITIRVSKFVLDHCYRSYIYRE